MIALLLATVAWAGVRLDRVEVLSDDPGRWFNYELPVAHRRFSTATLRFVEQVQPTWEVGPVYIGTSIASQSVAYEQARGPWRAWGGVQTRLLLPSGLVAGGGWRKGHFQAGAGLSLLSATTWRRPDWKHWDVMPTISVSWVRRPANVPAEEATP